MWGTTNRLEVFQKLFGVLVEFLYAGFAAEFHFLSFVNFGDDFAHGAKFVIRHDAGVFSVRLLTVGKGTSDEQTGGD